MQIQQIRPPMQATVNGLQFTLISKPCITLAELPLSFRQNYQNYSVYNFIKALTLLKSGGLATTHNNTKYSFLAEIENGCVTSAINAARQLQKMPLRKILQLLNIPCYFNYVTSHVPIFAPSYVQLYYIINHAHM